MVDVRALIAEARHGAVSPESARALVRAMAEGAASDAQLAAWLMAICCRGMAEEAAAALTLAMAESGRQLDLAGLPHTADKHSTGGVGDKTTLVACPIASAAGCTVAKMSGRGLGHTGGTIDKLESIPGFRTCLEPEEFLRQAREVGLVIAEQTGELAPADKRLYALRNETATVDSIPLIAASVMSKKLAAGARAIVLDVKWGRGAFLPTREQALELARLMVRIAEAHGRRAAAALSPMGLPLGLAIGNALEVREAIETLRGGGPEDLRELALELAARMVALSRAAPGFPEARTRCVEALANGAALGRLREMVAAQGGDTRAIDEPELLPTAPIVRPLISERDGPFAGLDALAVAQAVALLGGSRRSREEGPDPAVGVVLAKRPGESLARGETVCVIHARSEEGRLAAASVLREDLCRVRVPGPKRAPVEWLA